MSPDKHASLDDALDGMVRAIAGMSQVEKNGTMNWLQHTYKDASAPPAAKAFAQASYVLIGAMGVLATSPDEPGYTANAAEAERLLRRMRENRERVDRIADGRSQQGDRGDAE